jgi:ketosteroid isomerase-like protein
MSQENVEIVRMLLDKFRAGEYDVFEHYHPEIEWDATRGAQHVPEIANRYHGHAGVRAYWRAWLAAWQPIEVFNYELTDAGESVLVLISGQRNRGRHSGIEVEMQPYGLVFALRDRKVVRCAFYSDPTEAIRAAGLSED